MLYLGNPCSEDIRAAMRASELGMITTPAQGNALVPGAMWAADNGCFGKGYPGDRKWREWLERHVGDAARCLWATAPDVVGDAVATLARSAPHLPTIRELGYPAALVAQDGLERLEVPWDSFDVLFLGGSTEWKLGEHAARLTATALDRGKRVHMGRVNSGKRFRYAKSLGCHSADGTFLVFGPDKNLVRLRRWISESP